MSTPPPLSTAVLSPCTGICRLDVRGYCEGCLRTGAEIAHWRHLSDAERLHYMQQILPARSVR
ncbi:MAG: DUF1289 domain-containing protein [Dyella sp.]